MTIDCNACQHEDVPLCDKCCGPEKGVTPFEKARAKEGRVNYCDECERFVIVGNAAYCTVDGKMIHPIMLMRGKGTGPAWNCSKRKNPKTNYEKVVSMTVVELANFICDQIIDRNIGIPPETWIEWLMTEVDDADTR